MKQTKKNHSGVQKSWLGNRLDSLIRFSAAHPSVVLLVSALLLAFSLWGAAQIQLKTSNLDLIDSRLPDVARFLSYADEFGTPNTLVIVFEGDETEALGQAVDLVAPQLRNVPGVRRVLDKLPLDPNHPLSAAVDPYLSSDDQSMYFVFLQPEDPRTDVVELSPLIKQVRQIVRYFVPENSGINVGYTGIPQYALDDQEIIQRDISTLSVVSLVVIFLLFILSFGSIRRPLLATLTLLVGVVFSLGTVALYPGHLTLLSAPYAAMILGLGIDYGIHIINRLEELIAEGVPEDKAIVQAICGLRAPLLTACLTTAGVFFVLTLSGFLGFRELGVIAGLGMLICLLLMYTLLPALLALRPSGKLRSSRFSQTIGRGLVSLPRGLLSVLLLAASLALLFVEAPSFDSDYLNLQPIDSEAVRLERAMIEGSSYSPYFAVFVVDSLEASRALTQKLKQEEIVGAVRSLSDNPLLLETGESRADLSAVPDEVRGIFDSANGRYAVYAYPAGNLWEPSVEQAFLDRMRKIDSQVSGMPFLGNLMITQTKEALRTTAKLAALVLLIVIAFQFRRPCPIVLTLITPLLTVIWMQALMRLFGISYNPLNIMALPIALGISVDDSVHIVHRFLAERGSVERTLAGAGRSVVLTTLTTLAAFGCIAVSTHQGLRSFSLTLCAGLVVALILSVVVLPWLLEQSSGLLLDKGDSERGLMT